MSFPSRRRGSLAISVAILKAAKRGVRKTHLISLVSLSYEQFIKYAEFLEANGFIQEYDNIYATTEKGLELIMEFDSSSLIRSVLVT